MSYLLWVVGIFGNRKGSNDGGGAAERIFFSVFRGITNNGDKLTVIFTMHLAITEILHWHLALSGSFFLFLWHSFAATLYAALLKKEVLSLTINVWLYITVLFAYEFEVHWNKQIPSLIHCKSAEAFKIYTKGNTFFFNLIEKYSVTDTLLVREASGRCCCCYLFLVFKSPAYLVHPSSISCFPPCCFVNPKMQSNTRTVSCLVMKSFKLLPMTVT